MSRPLLAAMEKVRIGIGMALVGLGSLLIIGLLAAVPYMFYVGLRYDWLDDRISWAFFGVPGALLGMGLARAGFLVLGKSR